MFTASIQALVKTKSTKTGDYKAGSTDEVIKMLQQADRGNYLFALEALKNWPKEQELADLNSMFHFANYLREFILGFIEIVEPLKPYRKKGAKWEDSLQDKKAQAAADKLRNAVAHPDPGLEDDLDSFASGCGGSGILIRNSEFK